MNPLYLLDPSLIELNRGDSHETVLNRYGALMKMKRLHRKYGMRRVKFLAEYHLRVFNTNHANFQRADGQEIAQIIKSILLTDECQDQPVEIVDMPAPALSPQWLSALGENGCDESPPNWRRPIIVFPEYRSALWPNHAENPRELKYRKSGSTEPTARNLVCIENYDEHSFFEPDLDSWRIGTVGEPASTGLGAIDERHGNMQRLPRSLLFLPLNLTFADMWHKLQKSIDWSCGEEGKAYFLPDKFWDPRDISRDDWRAGRIFRTDTVQSGRRGPVDRKGRIWLWDQLKNNHWDVQLPDGGHVNVSHDGRILNQV